MSKTLFLQLPNGDQFTIQNVNDFSLRDHLSANITLDCYFEDSHRQMAIIPAGSLVLPLDAAISPTPEAFAKVVGEKDEQIASLSVHIAKLEATIASEKEWHKKDRKMDNDEIVDLANKNRKLTEWLATLITMGIITVAIAVINHFFPFFG